MSVTQVGSVGTVRSSGESSAGLQYRQQAHEPPHVHIFTCLVLLFLEIDLKSESRNFFFANLKKNDDKQTLR